MNERPEDGARSAPNLPTFPGHTLQRLLGRGNSAWVYLALDDKGRKVALKLPFPGTLTQPDRAERFANEVRLSLQLRHDHVVVGHAGTAFGQGAHLSMRYFPEGTLSRWMEMGRLSTPEALRLLSDLAHALSFLHGQGVVHQDVKSQNVYLDAGRAALGDFGAAFFVAQGGKTAGSPFYMAPEIYRGEPGTFATDVYSLGVLAYEMLAGERPYRGDTYDALMAAHLGRYPRPLANLVPELPRPLAQLLERAFAKTAGERPTAVELRRALEAALGREVVDDSVKPAASGAAKLGRQGAVASARHQGSSAVKTTGITPPPDEAKGAGPDARTTDARTTWWNPFKKRG